MSEEIKGFTGKQWYEASRLNDNSLGTLITNYVEQLKDENEKMRKELGRIDDVDWV
jgi:hypothetical protein